jgi:hypothetical protein
VGRPERRVVVKVIGGGRLWEAIGRDGEEIRVTVAD